MIVALLMVVVLGAGAIFLTGGNGTPAHAGPLLSVDPASATEIRMDFPDGSHQTVRRDAGAWRVVVGGADRPERSWPASQTQVHAALRILANLVPDQEVKGKVDKVAGLLTVKSGEASQTLRISDQRLGGRVLVEAPGPRSAWVDADVAEMLITTGIRAWRDPSAFPGLGSPSVITMSSDKSLVMAKVQNKWAMRLPITEQVDPEAVARLLTILGAVRIVDFCDGGPPTHTGLDQPIASLQIQSSVREGEAGTWKLDVGAAAGIADNTFVARVTEGAAPAKVVIVAGEQLAAISTDPVYYASRQPLRCEPTEIGHIAVTSETRQGCKRAEFRRNPDGWESRCDLGEWKPALKADIQAMEQLIDLCTTALPERVELKGHRTLSGAGAVVELNTAGGTPLGRVSIIIDASRLTIMNDNLFRDYAENAGKPLVEWLQKR